MYHNPQAVVQVNGRRSIFAIFRCGRAARISMSSRWSPLRKVRGQVRPCAVYLLLAALRHTFADDITVFVSRRLDIKAVKEAVVE